jgi:hypothetical protein
MKKDIRNHWVQLIKKQNNSLWVNDGCIVGYYDRTKEMIIHLYGITALHRLDITVKNNFK